MRAVRSTAVIVVAMLLAALTASAPSRAQEELPVGTKLLEGEITSGILVDGPTGVDPSVEFFDYEATENAWQFFLHPGDDQGALLEGAGVVARRTETVNVENSFRQHSVYRDVVEFEVNAVVSPDGTVQGLVKVRFPPESQSLEVLDGPPQNQEPAADKEGNFNGTWSDSDRTLTGRITADWIDSTLEASQTGVQPAPRLEPIGELFVGAGPYGLDWELLKSLCERWQNMPNTPLSAFCLGTLSSGVANWERSPQDFAQKLLFAVVEITRLEESGDFQAPAFANPGVLQVMTRLAQTTSNDPSNEEALTAFVRLFNFGLRIGEP